MRKRYVILAAVVALTLVGAPTLAYATDGTEATSSLDTQITQTNTQITPTSQATAKATGEQTTPLDVTESPASTESPAAQTQPTESSASGPTTEASLSGSKPQESSPVASPTATPATVEPTAPEEYVLAVWRNAAGSDKFPQYLVASYLTTSTNVKVLEQYAQLCGTFYQSDLYVNDARTQALIAKGVLNGGDESWPLDAYGNMIQRYDTLTTQPCQPTPAPTPTDEPTEPEVTPSPSTSLPTASPTAPFTPSAEPSAPGATETPSTTPSPTIMKSDAPVAPSTERKATGTPTPLTGTSSSLAYTGADNGPLVGIAVLAVFVGALAVVLAKNRKRK